MPTKPLGHMVSLMSSTTTRCGSPAAAVAAAVEKTAADDPVVVVVAAVAMAVRPTKGRDVLLKMFRLSWRSAILLLSTAVVVAVVDNVEVLALATTARCSE